MNRESSALHQVSKRNTRWPWIGLCLVICAIAVYVLWPKTTAMAKLGSAPKRAGKAQQSIPVPPHA